MRDFGADYHVQVLNGSDKVIYENEPGQGAEDPLLAPLFNLRQGPFARRRRIGIDWPLVRRLAIMGAGILALTLAIDLADDAVILNAGRVVFDGAAASFVHL